MLDAEAYVRIGSEMDYELRAFHSLCQTLPVKQVSFMESELRMGRRVLQKSALPGRHIIDTDNAVTRREKAVHHVTPDKARRSGN
jgi:hypothetical protein